jgi:polysaccharide export outer membrane protein
MKTPANYNFATPPKESAKEYKISPNDLLEFRIFSNDGFKLIDLTSLNQENNGVPLRTTMEYLVEFDGNIKLPILGRVMLKDLTIREAEQMLEEKYSVFYNKPFVMMKVTNRRVIVFPGSGGNATVVNLQNENTTLIEAIAKAGGITNTGRAKRVKLIRGDLKNPQVFLINLSTIEGVKNADLVMQANDIIYVEPIPRISQGLVAELAPIISILTSTILIYSFVKSF